MSERSQPNSRDLMDIMGPRVAFLTPKGDTGDYCVLRAIVPVGVVVPLHSHPDRETMCVLDGRIEGFLDETWRSYGPGGAIDIPGGVKYALRNTSGQDVTLLLVSTARMGQFFAEIGEPVARSGGAPPTPERVARFIDAARRYGFWLGSEKDNAAVALA
ncbi:cupin domain-containing protein [Roseomonas populi]|uniref:Cupin domain-containing protein n=1 Tax=Roseomonas populi TaxID=3121582 RepID=A0ABT1X6R0_9PROT|nr:cupin domain-containing protein [Roseomonas pecuniae]MCR0983789.1 cupin domain-containing protein [Roseomonas pecuniae]